MALERALGKVAVLKADVLPKVAVTLRGAEARYIADDVNLTKLLAKRRESTLNQMRYLEALRSVMEAWAGLTGYPHPEN